MIFDPWDVILAGFPFVETDREKLRPVVVLSSSDYNRSHGLLIVAMITTAPRGSWDSDTAIADLAAAGLRRRCFVRLKLATVSVPGVERRLGSLATPDRDRVIERLNATIPFRVSD